MFRRYEDSIRPPFRPHITLMPTFDNKLLPLQPASRNLSPFPKWSNASAGRDLLARPSFSLNDPLPMPKRIPVSRKYSHIQSKVAEFWQDKQTRQTSTLPLVIVDYEKSLKNSPKTNRMKKGMELNQVGEEIAQQAIGFHVRQLSRGILSQSPDEDKLYDEQFKFEDFGIEDFLSVTGSDDGDTLDMRNALHTKPPKVLDCHLFEIIPESSNKPPSMDDFRTPTPSSDIGVDGFPDECRDDDFCNEERVNMQAETKKEAITPAESERSESEVSLNLTIASPDSIGE